MKTAKVRSRCECQARLEAQLDENGIADRGTARSLYGDPEVAPATAIGAGNELFEVGWLCPFCGRNTVRSFHKSALSYEGTSDEAPTTTPSA